jgi:hypothetical protein
MLVCKYHGLAVVRLNVCFKDAYNLRKMKEYQPILDCYARVVLAIGCAVTRGSEPGTRGSGPHGSGPSLTFRPTGQV